MLFFLTAGDILTLQNGAGVPPPADFPVAVRAVHDMYADRRGEMRYALDALEQNMSPDNQSERHQIGFTRVGWREQDFKIRGAESGHTHFMTKLVLPGTI